MVAGVGVSGVADHVLNTSHSIDGACIYLGW